MLELLATVKQRLLASQTEETEEQEPERPRLFGR